MALACAELERHLILEEEILYPAARTTGEVEQLIAEAEIEQGLITALVVRLDALSPADRAYRRGSARSTGRERPQARTPSRGSAQDKPLARMLPSLPTSSARSSSMERERLTSSSRRLQE
jgi:hypothetical protein